MTHYTAEYEQRDGNGAYPYFGLFMFDFDFIQAKNNIYCKVSILECG